MRIRREAVIGKLCEELPQRDIGGLGAFRTLMDAREVKVCERRGLRRQLRGHARERAFVRAAVARVDLIEPAENGGDLRAFRILPDESLEHFLGDLRPACREPCLGFRECCRGAEIPGETRGRSSVRSGDEWREAVERRCRLSLAKVNARLDVADPVFIRRGPRRRAEQAASFGRAAFERVRALWHGSGAAPR